MRKPFIISLLIICFCYLGLFLTLCSADFKAFKKTIVIDPGHGGHDRGVIGKHKTNEKDITLLFARQITELLRQEYHVVLTRTSDYNLEIPMRTAIANENKAELFLSIHAGGSFSQSARGIIFYYFDPLTQKKVKGKSNQTGNPNNSNFVPQVWNKIQLNHKVASQKLADKFRDQFFTDDKYGVPKVIGAPLLVLAGADMPAVLVELSFLSNTFDEKLLTDKKFLKNMAQRLKKGIDAFILEKD